MISQDTLSKGIYKITVSAANARLEEEAGAQVTADDCTLEQCAFFNAIGELAANCAEEWGIEKTQQHLLGIVNKLGFL
jgi:hypothetical protein